MYDMSWHVRLVLKEITTVSSKQMRSRASYSVAELPKYARNTHLRRYVDLVVTEGVRHTVRARSKIISAVGRSLEERNFSRSRKTSCRSISQRSRCKALHHISQLLRTKFCSQNSDVSILSSWIWPFAYPLLVNRGSIYHDTKISAGCFTLEPWTRTTWSGPYLQLFWTFSRDVPQKICKDKMSNLSS